MGTVFNLHLLDYVRISCYVHCQMKIAAILPHLEIFGGVRRYIEIGNELSKRGHHFVLFSPEGDSPYWLEFTGRLKSFSFLEEEEFDVALCSEYSILSSFKKLKAKRKFFYFLLQGHKMEKEVATGSYILLGNSEGMSRRIEKKYKVPCSNVAGGVNPQIFYPLEREDGKDELRILCYGRIYKKRKGIQYIIRAVEGLHKKFPHLRLIFFDSLVGEDKKDPRPMIKTPVPHNFYLNLPQDKMAWLYSQADIFVSAEMRAGWSNTSAEAMACKIPVVCTKSGTQDFAFHNQTTLVVPLPLPFLLRRQIQRLIKDDGLRNRLSAAGYEKICGFTWSALADKLERTFREHLQSVEA